MTMAVSIKHVLEQGPVLRALGEAAIASLRPPRGTSTAPGTPGPWIEATLPPRSPSLLRDYVRHVGGDPSWYRGHVPAHLFPQWGFPLAARTLVGLPYPLTKVLNAGCRIEQRAPLPAGEPLLVRARLESIDDDGRRAILVQRVITGTRSAEDALIADMRVFVPLGRRSDGDRDKARPAVPAAARELSFLRIGPQAGLDFAKLTGDFNPIHWLLPYARAAGLRSTILHGFATLARAIEAMNRALFAGDPARLRSIDVRFTRPLLLPAKVGVYVMGDGIWVGDAASGGAYLEGRFTTENAT
jgi:hypothetical protein